MGTIWNRSNTVEWDANGDRASGALAYFYDAGTSTPRPVYEDAALSTPHDHPVVADGNGRWPAVFLSYGSYKETVTTSGGSQLWSTDNIPNPEPFDETFELDEDAIYNTGDFILNFKNGPRAGAVQCNGETIGNAASGGTGRANADTVDLFAFIYNSAANGQAAVSGGRGASAAADYAANKTIALPDFRNASLIGFGDMGNTDLGGAASAPIVSGSPILAGSIIGANTHALVTGELASHTHTGTTATEAAHTHTGETGGPNANHTHTYSNTTGGASANHTHNSAVLVADIATTPGSTSVYSPTTGNASSITSGTESAVHTHSSSGTTGNESAVHVHSFTTAAGSAHSHTFTSAASGSGTAHNNLSRAIPITVLMKL